MFVKVVHYHSAQDQVTENIYECTELQYKRGLDYGDAAEGSPDTEPEPKVELILDHPGAARPRILNFTRELGNKAVYVMNGEGQTVESYYINW